MRFSSATVLSVFLAALVQFLGVQSAPLYPGHHEPGGGAHYGFDSGSRYEERGGYGHGGASGYSSRVVTSHAESGGKKEEYLEDRLSKYYYGGQYKGLCQGDGLYYKDDNTFVMCSNGYSHEQPCPPGTKTSGSPSYKPGYYYGYTDLCSVNLVDYGLGPEHYAPFYNPAEKGAERGGYSGETAYARKDVYDSKEIHPGSSHHQTNIHKEKVFDNADYGRREVVKKDATISTGVELNHHVQSQPAYHPQPHGHSPHQVHHPTAYVASEGHKEVTQYRAPNAHGQAQSYLASAASHHEGYQQGRGHVALDSYSSAQATSHGRPTNVHHHQQAISHGGYQPIPAAAYPTHAGYDTKVEGSASKVVYHSEVDRAPAVGGLGMYHHVGDHSDYRPFIQYAYPQLGTHHPVNRPIPTEYRVEQYVY